MKTIYKYPLEVTDSQFVELPIGSEILDIQIQNGVPCLWALVDPKRSKENIIIKTFGTGHDIPSNSIIRYISTYQINGLVFHTFLGNRI